MLRLASGDARQPSDDAEQRLRFSFEQVSGGTDTCVDAWGDRGPTGLPW